MKIILLHLKSPSSNLSNCRISWKKKMPKFGTKNALFRYFSGRTLKNYCHIWNWHPRICLFANFGAKMKILKFGTKNALFGYFWAGIFKTYCLIWNQHSQICIIAKFGEKIKPLKFGYCYLGTLGLKLKIRLSHLKSASSNLFVLQISWKNENA